MTEGQVLLGTSSFTAYGWQGTFYPRGLEAADYVAYYAEHFSTVEISFYGCPAAQTVRKVSLQGRRGCRSSG